MPQNLWPYEEARLLLRTFPAATSIVLETGYGPSGAPHIGTFAEVARTSWVGAALHDIGDKPWTLIAFSDDMDGLRKVPLNMPAEKLAPHLGKPLSHVPDPFDCHPSYAAHNNAKLREMLDRFGFRYTFVSSHDQYTTGAFNDGLTRIIRNCEEVRQVILPTIREEKRAAWSPFFPICEGCGRINGTRVTGYDASALTVDYVCEGDRSGAVGDDRDETAGTGAGCGCTGTVSVLDGRVKVGWKVDWALRWYSLGVHYEMYGKDLIESAELSAQICRVISGRKGPVQSFYEMFLDEEGRKISKSVGRGLSIDTWCASAPMESLLLFIFKDPRKAKRLSWDVVSRSADEYLQLLQRHYAPPAAEGQPTIPGGGKGKGKTEDDAGRDELGFIQPGLPGTSPYEYPVSYSMLLSLIGAVGVPAPEVVMDYVHHYHGAVPSSDRMLEALVGQATTFVQERVQPNRKPLALSAEESRPVRALADYLHEDGRGAPEREAEEIQTAAFNIAREAGMEPKAFFRLLYGVLTGQDSGPRFGSFVKLLGQGKVSALLRKAANHAGTNGP